MEGVEDYYPSVFVLGMDNSFVYWGGTLVATAVCLLITGLFWKYGLSKVSECRRLI